MLERYHCVFTLFSETGFYVMVAPECLICPSLNMVFLSNYQLKQPGKI